MEILPYIAIAVFGTSLIAIIFEIFDKAIIALVGALFFVLVGVLTPEAALDAIDFETILLLMGMMMLVEIAKHSGVFSVLNVRVAKFSRGNPLLIMVLFSLITALCSAFLDNVTTILLVVPLTIALTRGMGLDPKIYVVAEIIFANVGGALTLIGDPTNIIVGSAARLSFNDFIVNLAVPVFSVIALVTLLLIMANWSQLKPIGNNLKKIFLSSVLIKKIRYTFLREDLKRSYIWKTVALIMLTLVGFALHDITHIQPHIIALLGATLLLLYTTKYSSVHDTLQGVEWPTLIYFAGLFVMVAGLKNLGVLDRLSDFFLGFSDNFILVLLVLVWFCGLISTVLDNVPFVTIMVPVVQDMQNHLIGVEHVDLLWWALALGVVFGGIGTPVGAATNVVGIAVARNSGVRLAFMDYFKVSFPIMLLSLTVASVYFAFRIML